MKPLERDISILEHIISYCLQIEETVQRNKLISANRVGFQAGICQSPETGPIAIFFHCAGRVCPIGTLSTPRSPP